MPVGGDFDHRARAVGHAFAQDRGKPVWESADHLQRFTSAHIRSPKLHYWACKNKFNGMNILDKIRVFLYGRPRNCKSLKAASVMCGPQDPQIIFIGSKISASTCATSGRRFYLSSHL